MLGPTEASQCSGPNHDRALPAALSLNKYFLKSVLRTRKDLKKKKKSPNKPKKGWRGYKQHQIPMIRAPRGEDNLLVFHI